MIVGIGVDLVEKKRVCRAYENESFRKKYFTDKEQEEIAELPHRAASDFAVKEAVVKAFGTGFGKIMPIQVEVLRKHSGMPYVMLYGMAEETGNMLGIHTIHVSVSDTDALVIAYVVCEG